MEKQIVQLELFETRFNHDDTSYEMWYDREVEMCEDEEGNPKDFNCDNVYARTELGKAYIDWINEELGTNMQFSSMFFPKEYNFDSDAINVKFTSEDLVKLITWSKSEENKQALVAKIEGYTTSRSGYYAFHTSNEVENNTELLMGMLLETYSDLNSDEFSDYFDRQCVYDRLYKEAV